MFNKEGRSVHLPCRLCQRLTSPPDILRALSGVHHAPNFTVVENPGSPAIDTAGKDWERQNREQQAELAVRGGGTYSFLG